MAQLRRQGVCRHDARWGGGPNRLDAPSPKQDPHEPPWPLLALRLVLCMFPAYSGCPRRRAHVQCVVCCPCRRRLCVPRLTPTPTTYPRAAVVRPEDHWRRGRHQRLWRHRWLAACRAGEGVLQHRCPVRGHYLGCVSAPVPRHHTDGSAPHPHHTHTLSAPPPASFRQQNCARCVCCVLCALWGLAVYDSLVVVRLLAGSPSCDPLMMKQLSPLWRA